MKKESDNVFDLVIQHPLSPLQAMAIAMTRFDVQLNWFVIFVVNLNSE